MVHPRWHAAKFEELALEYGSDQAALALVSCQWNVARASRMLAGGTRYDVLVRLSKAGDEVGPDTPTPEIFEIVPVQAPTPPAVSSAASSNSAQQVLPAPALAAALVDREPPVALPPAGSACAAREESPGGYLVTRVREVDLLGLHRCEWKDLECRLGVPSGALAGRLGEFHVMVTKTKTRREAADLWARPNCCAKRGPMSVHD